MAHVVTLVASTEILSTAQCEIAVIVIAGVGTRETGLQGKKTSLGFLQMVRELITPDMSTSTGQRSL